MGTRRWNALGRIEVSEEYRDFVESKFSNTTELFKVEYSASAEGCENDCMYW